MSISCRCSYVICLYAIYAWFQCGISLIFLQENPSQWVVHTAVVLLLRTGWEGLRWRTIIQTASLSTYVSPSTNVNQPVCIACILWPFKFLRCFAKSKTLTAYLKIIQLPILVLITRKKNHICFEYTPRHRPYSHIPGSLPLDLWKLAYLWT